MRPIIYARFDCQRCKAFLQALNKAGIRYTVRTYDDYVEPHDGWRDDGSIELLTFVQMECGDDVELPIVSVDGRLMHAAEAAEQLGIDFEDES